METLNSLVNERDSRISFLSGKLMAKTHEREKREVRIASLIIQVQEANHATDRELVNKFPKFDGPNFMVLRKSNF